MLIGDCYPGDLIIDRFDHCEIIFIVAVDLTTNMLYNLIVNPSWKGIKWERDSMLQLFKKVNFNEKY